MLVENQDIPGLELIENFISNDEENKLINYIYKNNWDTTIKRRVQHYGINFEYKFRKIEKNMEPKEFPDWMNLILDKLKDIKVLKNFNPNQCTINEYEPGVGIAPHIDTHSCFGKIIISLSLESNILMNFKNKISNKDKVSLLIPRLSLLIMTEESRYCFSHGITARKTDVINKKIIKRKKRISLTFREISKNPCNCIWDKLCDSQNYTLEKTRLS